MSVQRNVPRVNLEVAKLQRQFTGGFIKSNGIARPKARVVESVRSTRIVRRDDNFQPPPPPPPSYFPQTRGSPLIATVVVGGIVASCIVATGWHKYMKIELASNRAQARKWMTDFPKNWVLSLSNMDEQR